MTDFAETRYARGNSHRKQQFYNLYLDFEGGSTAYGLQFSNGDRIQRRETPYSASDIEQQPHLNAPFTLGRLSHDLEELAGIWIVSERLRRVFETIDADGFVFMDCDYQRRDGSPGPKHYMCDVVRKLDAVDERASQVKVDFFPPDYRGYSFSGGARLAFKLEVIGCAQVFRTPYSGNKVFCTRAMRDAVRIAKPNGLHALTGLRFRDAADM